ncbi:MAG: hypothetical protein AAB481_00230 [Patescibacteria group bacterium]
MDEVQTPGFQQSQEPKDDWVARLYQKYELGPTPSLEEIEPIATRLLSDIKTALAGAELVLGRRVDGNVEKEPDVLPLLTTTDFSGTERFGLLLMQKGIEKAQTAARTAATTV